MVRSAMRRFCVGAFPTAILGVLAWCATSTKAQESAASVEMPIEPIVITAKKHLEPLSDEEVTKRVEAALVSDPYVYAEHVSVTTKDGVVTLQGMVLDAWDLIAAKRISNGVAGVNRVANELDLNLGGSD